MKRLSIIGLAIGMLFAIHFAAGTTTADRPAGVPEKYWIPLSDTMGFVVIPVDPREYPRLLTYPQLRTAAAPPATGFFMAKTGDGWRHLIVIDPPPR